MGHRAEQVATDLQNLQFNHFNHELVSGEAIKSCSVNLCPVIDLHSI